MLIHASRFSAQSLSVPSSRPACSPRARRVVPEGPTRGGGAGRARRVVKRDLSAQPHSIPARGALTLTYFAWLARQSSSPRFWDPRPQARIGFKPLFGSQNNDDHFVDEKRHHNLEPVVRAQRLVGFCHQNESGRNKPSFPWMGDGGVFAAASFGPPTPTFWLEAGPEVFACTRREGRVFNVGLNPPCTPRARGSLLLCIRPPSFWSGRRPPRSPPSKKISLIPTAEPGRSCPTAGVDVRRLLTFDGWSSG